MPSKIIKLGSTLALSAVALSLVACSPSKQDYLRNAENAFVQQNYGVSFSTLQAAANSGSAQAQYALGYLYFYGMGTQSNTVQAIKWFQKAARQGLPAAKTALSLIQAQQANVITDKTPKQTANNPIIKLGPNMSTPPSMSNRRPARNRADKLLPKPKALVRSYSFVQQPKQPARKATVTTSSNAKAGNLTLRLYANYSLANAQAFIRNNKLQGKANIRTKQLNGKTLYVVLYGRYNSTYQARQAIKQLPASIKNNSPWIQSWR